ncbi:hypothetical protein BU24DRAFT_475098 [Aaosphaeria arxii CBS 175.79]|uniref:Uncharacterized protein n=1 Tax=Aaosphaeria arxii CBS 175.79 TaxID=1450172 RepID=A0A6A5X6X5_9PLEO|nr:uncharacterized protein BU24DRAFT_475098 [Aaosphaeria arxii CBS 175.79]KAF2008636.1 hypothetical protein BU24DRAFT_475098 [Aaosphaeria arxii CBS 175.79]
MHSPTHTSVGQVKSDDTVEGPTVSEREGVDQPSSAAEEPASAQPPPEDTTEKAKMSDTKNKELEATVQQEETVPAQIPGPKDLPADTDDHNREMEPEAATATEAPIKPASSSASCLVSSQNQTSHSCEECVKNQAKISHLKQEITKADKEVARTDQEKAELEQELARLLKKSAEVDQEIAKYEQENARMTLLTKLNQDVESVTKALGRLHVQVVRLNLEVEKLNADSIATRQKFTK